LNRKIIIVASIAGVAAVAALTALLLRKEPIREIDARFNGNRYLEVDHYLGFDGDNPEGPKILNVQTDVISDSNQKICGEFLGTSGTKQTADFSREIYFCPEEKTSHTTIPLKKCDYFVSGRCEMAPGSPGGPRLFKTDVNKIKISDEQYLTLKPLLKDRHGGGRDRLVLTVDEGGRATFVELLISGHSIDTFPDWERRQRVNRGEEGEFIVLRVGSDEPKADIVFTNKSSSGKPQTLSFTKQGFFSDDDSLTCMRNNGFMDECPDDSPIGDSEWLDVGVEGFWEYSAPYTVLRISALKEKTVEINYKGQTFSGEIPVSFTVVAKKGSAIYKAQEESLEKTGVNTLIKELSACMTPQLKEESCFDKLVGWPLNAVIGVTSPGEEHTVYENVHEFYDALKQRPEAQEFGILKSCLSGEFIKWVIGDHSITVRKEEFNEAAPYCRFKKVDGRWNLDEIADGLNYKC
jgi:hypothetical protein